MHTLVLIRYPRRAEANALANSELFANNGNAFEARLHPVGQPEAADADCWSWCCGVFSESKRAALATLAMAPEWVGDVQVFDADLGTTPDFAHAKLGELGLAVYAPPLN
ncbi:MAG: hypothetical protein ACO25M_05060 [Limnohabitans sp.]